MEKAGGQAQPLPRVPRLAALSRARRASGLVLAVAALSGLTAGLVSLPRQFALSSTLLLYLLVMVVVTVIGGAWAAAVAAVGGVLLANYFFTEPRHTLDMHELHDVLALAVFVIVGTVVATLVELSSRRAKKAARAEAATAALSQANDLRTALLRAVSHDLRTPLSSIKVSATSLLQRDVELTPELTRDFLVTINEESDRLDRLVGNLLDMSRLQAGAVDALCRPTTLEEVVPAALTSLGIAESAVVVDVPETLPQVAADPALLERVVANLVANAIAQSVDGTPVAIRAGVVADKVMLRVIDRGPGIPLADRERIFEPFQRLRDSGDGGVGLGLAVARGLVSSMGARLFLQDTAAGGTTMVIELQQA